MLKNTLNPERTNSEKRDSDSAKKEKYNRLQQWYIAHNIIINEKALQNLP